MRLIYVYEGIKMIAFGPVLRVLSLVAFTQRTTNWICHFPNEGNALERKADL